MTGSVAAISQGSFLESSVCLISEFYRFVRPKHKAMFDQTCRELIGEGCGHNPENDLKKKRAMESAAQSGESDFSLFNS